MKGYIIMKEIASVIILLVIIRLTSYGVWNIKEKRNITGAIGAGILNIAVIFMLATVIMRIV